jgi:hypothetical protein
VRRLRLPATAAALAAVLAATSLSACDASPYAAKVDGSTIKEAQLNTELRWAAGAADYSAVLVNAYENLNHVQLTQSGDTSNTYSSAWAAYTLSQMIQGQVVRRAEAARGRAPSSNLYTAALGGIELETGALAGSHGVGAIAQMVPAYLVEVTQRLADHADLEAALPDAVIAETLGYTNYSQIQELFYTQVCVSQATVSVQNPNGGVNFTASRAQAATVARHMTNAGAGAPALQGASTCYSHEQLDAQSASFIDTVTALAPGQANVQKTMSGYQVISVSSRQLLPLSGPVAQVLSAVIYDVAGPTHDAVLQGLEAKAKVRVNPSWGTWHAGSSSSAAAVVPNVASAAVPVGASGSLTSILGS